MKLKFKQSIATAKLTYNVGMEYDVEDKKQAKSFIEAGVAELVEVKETPSEKIVEETKELVKETKPKKRKQNREVGE